MLCFMNARHGITGEGEMETLWMLWYFLRRYPVYVLSFFANEILLALPGFVGNVLFLKYMMRALFQGEPVSRMLCLLGGTALFLILSDVYTAWFSGRYMPCAQERIQKDFYREVRDGAAQYGLEKYDNPAFYDDMTYINENLCKDSLSLLSFVSKMMAGLINILLVVRLFYEMGATVLLFSMGAVALSLIFDVPIIRLQNERKYVGSAIERKRRYFRDCFFMRETFPERKATSVNSLLHARYEESVEEQIRCEKRFGGKLFWLRFLKELLSTHLLMQLLLTAFLLYQVLAARTLQGSDFIAAYNAVNVVMGDMMLIVGYWGQMAAVSYTVGKYRIFLSAVPNTGTGGEVQRGQGPENEKDGGNYREEIRSIEFRNVSFSYPGTGKYVLKDISFCIRPGEKIAIVGRNGSGKTTLIHLLMGLYQPTEGEVLVNGKAPGQEELPAYRHRFAAFFQGMKPMEATAAENVALDTEIDSERLVRALQKADCGAMSDRPQEAMIGVLFEKTGHILSGGECQKLMLAHCFYSDKSVLVMDEPSSALDPAAEQAFNRQMAELAGDKLAVFVTHRLSTVRMSDTIYVIEEGRLCDKGTHEELAEKEGVYAQMWRIQHQAFS